MELHRQMPLFAPTPNYVSIGADEPCTEVAVEQEIVTTQCSLDTRLSDHESLSAGEVARTVAQYYGIRAHLPDTQWVGTHFSILWNKRRGFSQQ
jgi:hypothetical protein